MHLSESVMRASVVVVDMGGLINDEKVSDEILTFQSRLFLGHNMCDRLVSPYRFNAQLRHYRKSIQVSGQKSTSPFSLAERRRGSEQ